ncbi:hypothetical protein FHY55_07955 [Oceanicola sp. D3]|uniref:hypothetical protein n=1 Tax=Oceanicola sp. D3 TaxID=2587163 RepID=UPI0011215F51|nr:hypothetical protein [Oceanicola sp. D3]QDC09177.1 hypothetical protein FHY55_07955 [Oceanicola sp. D3]
MTVKFVKPFVAVAAMSMGLAAPATAQIAKFHVMTPTVPGMLKVDKISAGDDALADFVGSTGQMAGQKSASLGDMRAAESIIAGTGQEIERDDEEGTGTLEQLAQAFDGGNDNEETPTRPSQPVAQESSNDEHHDIPIVSRPEIERPVIVRTRASSPRGGAKINSGAMWSVGQFR